VLAVALVAGGSATAYATPVTGASGSQRYDKAHFQRDLDAIRATGITGVVGEIDRGRNRLQARTGVADVSTGKPVPYDAYFRMGSNTKTFVAIVVLQLVGEGKLSLDDTVDKWLPGVISGNGNDGRVITVRQLLQHTSGIYNYTNDLGPINGTPELFRAHHLDHADPTDLVAMAMRHPPVFAPGTSWDYSNTNYIVAGMIIKKVTGQDWSEQVQARILNPLGLVDTFYPGDWPNLPGPHAVGYQQFGVGGPLVDTTAVNYTWAGSAGSLVTTTADLSRFWQAVQRGELLRPAEQAEMHKTVLATTEQGIIPGARYGLGIMWIPLTCGGGYWAHLGDVFGYATDNAVNDDGSRTVVLSLSTQLASPQPFFAAKKLTDHAMCANK
jgi:D-alanyl-D-alanine carboxypeptidase